LVAFFTYWVLRLLGYSQYQARSDESSIFLTLFLHVALAVVGLVWLWRIRERYFHFIRDAREEKT
jgi:hypothetical protein